MRRAQQHQLLWLQRQLQRRCLPRQRRCRRKAIRSGPAVVCLMRRAQQHRDELGRFSQMHEQMKRELDVIQASASAVGR